jgi:prophage antirepressor-like protein
MPPKKELELIPEGELQICQFSGNEIRKVCHKDEWFFSIVDVIAALADTNRPAAYWGDLKTKLSKQEGFTELFDKIEKLPIMGRDGVFRPSEMANTETIFRIIQSIPSPTAEPFKMWLAKVGYERIQEYQNPSIAIKRAIVDYQLQGRSMEWVEARLRTIVSRKELTDEWQRRGIVESWEYAALTDAISTGTFSKTVQEYKDHKGLGKRHSLRDNMTPIELILTMLGETATKQIAIAKDSRGFHQNKVSAQLGGHIAGNARRQLEAQVGRSVVSSENKLQQSPPAKDLLELPPNFKESVERMAPKRQP